MPALSGIHWLALLIGVAVGWLAKSFI